MRQASESAKSASACITWVTLVLVSAGSYGGAVASFQAGGADPATPVPTVTLRGRPVFTAVQERSAGILDPDDRTEVWIHLSSLAQAVNGTPSLEPTMKIGGEGLYGVTLGGCDRCAFQIRKQGFIGRTRHIGGQRYVSLTDVARSAGLRCDTKNTRAAKLVDAGPPCETCVLLAR